MSRVQRSAVAGKRICSAMLLVALSGGLSACFLIPKVEREYQSNREVIDTAASAIGYQVAPEAFLLSGLDIRPDSVVFQYQGQEYPGDEAWVIRFSEKSSEQDPASLTSAHTMLAVVAEGREAFSPVGEFEKHEFAGHAVESVRFRFASPFRDNDGKPLGGHGILAVVRVRAGDDRCLVYQIKLENHGDRAGIGFADLTPFLESLHEEGVAPRESQAAARE